MRTRVFSLPRRFSRQEGSVLLLALFLLAVLAGFAMSQFLMVHKNYRQASFFRAHGELREYAESGIALCLHDLNFGFSGNDGAIGTTGWTSVNDVGKDGTPGTYDEGEADGIPTIGEPNAVPVPIGPARLNGALLVHVEDTANPEVKRVVSSCGNGEVSVNVEAYVKTKFPSLPRLAPIVVRPDVSINYGVLDKRQDFVVNGADYNMNGSRGSEAPRYAIATTEGDPAGDNQAALLAQTPPDVHDQLLGLGGAPSMGEVPEFDFDGLFQYFKSVRMQTVSPGNYDSNTQPSLGDAKASDFRITYVNGSFSVTAKDLGAGVLVVDGDLKMTGQSRFDGLVLARGNVELVGGGKRLHLFGSLMTAGTQLKVTGDTDVFYSTEALDMVENLMRTRGQIYSMVCYREI